MSKGASTNFLADMAIHEAAHMLVAMRLKQPVQFAVAKRNHGWAWCGGTAPWAKLVILAAGEVGARVVSPAELTAKPERKSAGQTPLPEVPYAPPPEHRALMKGERRQKGASDAQQARAIVDTRNACRRYRRELAAEGYTPEKIQDYVFQRYYKRATQRAYALLAPNHRKLEALSNVLVRHGVLTLATAQEVIRRTNHGDPCRSPV